MTYSNIVNKQYAAGDSSAHSSQQITSKHNISTARAHNTKAKHKSYLYANAIAMDGYIYIQSGSTFIPSAVYLIRINKYNERKHSRKYALHIIFIQ